MAIDHTTFAYWWALWAEKWNRNPSPAFLKEFRRAVDHLATDEFEAAARALWQGAGFFPSPADMLEKARPADRKTAALTLEASGCFEAVMGMASHGPHGPIWRREHIATTLGPAALRAFDLAGGQARFRTMTEQDEHWVRRDFVSAYVDQSREMQAILDASLANARRTAVGQGKRSPRLEHIGTVLPPIQLPETTGKDGTDG